MIIIDSGVPYMAQMKGPAGRSEECPESIGPLTPKFGAIGCESRNQHMTRHDFLSPSRTHFSQFLSHLLVENMAITSHYILGSINSNPMYIIIRYHCNLIAMMIYGGFLK